MERAVEGVDAVYHLAAAFGGPYNNIEYLQVNGLGTLHLLEAVRAHAPGLRRFIYASTEAIYWRLEQAGRLFDAPISEDMVSPTHMNYHVQYGVPSVSFRFATVFEPSEFLNEEGVPRFCALKPALERFRGMEEPAEEQRATLAELERAAGEGKRLLVSRCPDGRSFKQEWCDVRDIARGLALGLEREQDMGETFTLGGLLTVWGEVVPELADRPGMGYTEARMPEPNFFEFDRTKVRALLGYEAAHDLWSTLDAALAMRAGRETDVIPTGVCYG